jgi:hypothetical protein
MCIKHDGNSQRNTINTTAELHSLLRINERQFHGQDMSGLQVEKKQIWDTVIKDEGSIVKHARNIYLETN